MLVTPVMRPRVAQRGVRVGRAGPAAPLREVAEDRRHLLHLLNRRKELRRDGHHSLVLAQRLAVAADRVEDVGADVSVEHPTRGEADGALDHHHRVLGEA